MTYRELYEKACRMLDSGEINIGEWEQMTAPLDNEIEPKKGCKGCRQLKIHCFDCKRKATDWYKGVEDGN